MSEDKEVARCADVDVIIGGHEHSLLESSSGGAPIFKMTADARELGQIDLNISKNNRRGREHRLESDSGNRSRSKTIHRFAAINRKYGAF